METQIRNWKDIVDYFDTVKSVTAHLSKPVLVTTGIRKGKLTSLKSEYTYRPVMKGVSEKVSMFINI